MVRVAMACQLEDGATSRHGASIPERTWALFIQLGHNMWLDRQVPGRERAWYNPDLQWDDSLWEDQITECVKAGINMILLDVGDAVEYESHPEIVVENAWSKDRVKKELARLRDLGIELIPKLNFSAGHDNWLGKYSRMVSTDIYYGVCKDLIAEAIEMFEEPRFFHIGMDEEGIKAQKDYAITIIRQHELWWHDLHFYLDEVRKGGSIPWMWSDKYWHARDEFINNMPKDVIQSNWYYEERFDEDPDNISVRVTTYNDLSEHGFKQIPCGSNHKNDVNFAKTVAYCQKHINDDNLLGFLHAPWGKNMEQFREHYMDAIKQIEVEREGFASR